LAASGCFASVKPVVAEAPGADLELRVWLGDFREETEYAVSQAAQQDPLAHPDIRQAVRVAFIALVDLELLETQGRKRLRGRRYLQSEFYRPIMLEDARFAARQEMIKGVMQKGRAFACKGSAKKLAMQIERARASDPSR